MTGAKALKKVRKGYRVRRTHWSKGECVYQQIGTSDQHNKIVWGYGGKLAWEGRVVEATEFLHDDWEVVE